MLAPWAAGCAERTLPLFEAEAPHDPRPRAAIEGARAFARGELRIGPARALSVAAHAAARDVRDPAANAAARAAGHAVATAHMAAHARGAPDYAAIASSLASPGNPSAAPELIRWAVGDASAAVREALRRLPLPDRSGGKLGAFIFDLDAQCRAGD